MKMRGNSHLRMISRTPATGQSGLQVLMDGILAIIDRLLLAQRQAPFKSWITEGEEPAGGGGGGGIGNGGNGFGDDL